MDLCYRYRTEDKVILFLKSSKEKGLFTEYIVDNSIASLDKEILNIFNYIHEYGINSVEGDVSNEGLMARREYFIEKVHDGLRLAEDQIIKDLLDINSKYNILKDELKQARIDHDNDLTNKIKLELKELSNRENIFRKLADTIAWGYIIRDHPTARNLYIGQNMAPIQNSEVGIYSEFKKKFMRKYKLGFSLFADITSFIQIGDAICIVPDRENGYHLKIAEIKSGKINYKLLDMLTGKKIINEESMDALTKKELDQGLRIIRQYERSNSALSVIRDGEGIDATGSLRRTIDVEYVHVDHYDDTISDMLKNCEQEGWSIDVIDDCLYLGVYNSDVSIKNAYRSFMGWMNKLDVRYPITNFQSTFHSPLFKPPFLTGIDKMDLIEIALGEKLILACLDFDKWFEIGNSVGLNCDWLSRSESDKYIKERNGGSIFKYNNKIINMSFDASSFVMGDAVPARIFFEFLSPSSAMELQKEIFVQCKKEPSNLCIKIHPETCEDISSSDP
jgi:hypothetical protein